MKDKNLWGIRNTQDKASPVITPTHYFEFLNLDWGKREETKQSLADSLIGDAIESMESQ
jgi:hypothetical protein